MRKKLNDSGPTEYDKILDITCERHDVILNCTEEFIPIANHCLDSNGRKGLIIFFNLVKRLSDFVCYNHREQVISNDLTQ